MSQMRYAEPRALMGQMITKIRILIIDDDANTLKACEEILSSWGNATVTTCNGLAAMAVVCSCTPDIVLTELLMPRKDGIELLREIKLTSPQIKVIAMSGGGSLLSPELVLRLARQLGADGTVSKPVDAKSLLEAIEMALFPQDDD
jgi:CheY-like chemotaxis protein